MINNITYSDHKGHVISVLRGNSYKATWMQNELYYIILNYIVDYI